jgi:hypothetical protein
MTPFKFRKYICNSIQDDTSCRMVFSDKSCDQKYFSFNDHPAAIMQSTGLIDNNSKEIYESDILKIGDEYYMVIWNNIYAQFSFETKNKNYKNIMELVKNSLIVGNIFENIALIKKIIE